MNQIRAMFCTLENLFDEEMWSAYLKKIEAVSNYKLTHLDTNDPIRKKAGSLRDAAKYICDIGQSHNSRILHAKFGDPNLTMTIILYKDRNKFANNVSISFRNKIINSQKGISIIREIFDYSNMSFRPFYSLCDDVEEIVKKKKKSGFAVNLEAELIGVFWLTYFNSAYVEFFDREKFDTLPYRDISETNGVCFSLGELPTSLNISRDKVEKILGEDTFVDPIANYDKAIGKNALDYRSLKI